MRSYIHFFKNISLIMVLIVPNVSDAVNSAPASSAFTPDQVAVESPKTIDQIAREMGNPLAAFWRFDYEAQYRTFQGDIPGADDQTSWTWAYDH